MKTAISFQRSAISLFIMLICLFAVGCIPVDKPPQLQFTPGMPFVVTDEVFDAGVFSVRYPAGWRVISAEASAPPSVIFAAPEDAALMMLAVGDNIASPPTLANDFEMSSETRTLELGDIHITAYLTAPTAEWNRYLQLFEAVLASAASQPLSPTP